VARLDKKIVTTSKLPRASLLWLLLVSLFLFITALLLRDETIPPKLYEESPSPLLVLTPSSNITSTPFLHITNQQDIDQLTRLVNEMLAVKNSGAPPGAFRLYSYAFAGYALASAGRTAPTFRAEAKKLLDALIEKVIAFPSLALFSAGERHAARYKFSASVVMRGHLSLLLLGSRSLAPLTEVQESLLRDLIQGLAQDFSADPNHLLPSYGTTTYPADNELAATALAIYLEIVLEDPSVQSALEDIEKALSAIEVDGLPPSVVSADTLQGLDLPRGCALSWTVAFRAYRDIVSAQQLYTRYRSSYWVSLGPVVGFREWPRGVDRPPDADSGPIVLGVGTAASAIAMIAARLTENEGDYQRLRIAASIAGLEAIETKQKGYWLERAIALYAKTAAPWH
jgi:hypothetical protein